MFNKKKNPNKANPERLSLILGITLAILVVITVAYAALSSTLNITVNKVTQSILTWDVGFQTGTVTAVEGGTSGTGRSCGTATVTTGTVTIATTTLSKPDDSCTYALTVKNTGGIDAILGTITAVDPTGNTCTKSNGNAKMVCGNLTYSLATNAQGTTFLTTGGVLAKSTGTQTIYLIIKYTGATVSLNAEEQTSAGFTLLYNQQ